MTALTSGGKIRKDYFAPYAYLKTVEKNVKLKAMERFLGYEPRMSRHNEIYLLNEFCLLHEYWKRLLESTKNKRIDSSLTRISIPSTLKRIVPLLTIEIGEEKTREFLLKTIEMIKKTDFGGSRREGTKKNIIDILKELHENVGNNKVKKKMQQVEVAPDIKNLNDAISKDTNVGILEEKLNKLVVTFVRTPRYVTTRVEALITKMENRFALMNYPPKVLKEFHRREIKRFKKIYHGRYATKELRYASALLLGRMHLEQGRMKSAGKYYALARRHLSKFTVNTEEFNNSARYIEEMLENIQKETYSVPLSAAQ